MGFMWFNNLAEEKLWPISLNKMSSPPLHSLCKGINLPASRNSRMARQGAASLNILICTFIKIIGSLKKNFYKHLALRKTEACRMQRCMGGN